MKTRTDRSYRILWAAMIACVLEVSSEKPGNVTPTYDFADTSYADFLLSAVGVAPVLSEADACRVGELVRRGVEATRKAVKSNTNLGILLLFAPLARAYALAADQPTTDQALQESLSRVLADLDQSDAEEAYAAIRLASPGGLGTAEHDVREAPRVTLREAMASAADRDAIAREYVTGFALTAKVGLPALRRALGEGLRPGDAIVTCFLSLLAACPDSLVVRKLGSQAANVMQKEAQALLQVGGVASHAGRAGLQAMTLRLRDPENRLNPGTTADLTAAAIFWLLLVNGPVAMKGERLCGSSWLNT